MAALEFRRVGKVYADGTHAVEDFSLSISEGELTVLVGPSGCGKTTLMRVLAGLETCTAGEIRIGDQRVNDWTPQQRNVAMVFQNYALYPHMTVRGNLAFPLRMLKLSKDETNQRIEKTASLLGLTGMLERRPRQLSGGQRQRVAMGRALVRDPSVFLMDEPLSNLDARLRVQIRSEISNLQRRTRNTTLYVTHDQVEAMTLGDRVCVLDGGVLQQAAAPMELYDRPANTFVASFLGSPGMNLFPGRINHAGEGAVTLQIGSQRILIPAETGWPAVLPVDQAVLVGIRPEAMQPSGSPAINTTLLVEVEDVESLGHEHLAHGQLCDLAASAEDDTLDPLRRLGITPGRITARLPAGTRVSAGDTLTLRIWPEQLHFFARDGTALRPRVEAGRITAAMAMKEDSVRWDAGRIGDQ